MLSSHLSMYEQEQSEIQEVADRLQQDSRSRTILIVDKNGQMIAASGVDANLDTTSLSSLVAGNVAAVQGMAKLIEEDEFSGQFHEGRDLSVHMTIVGRRLILVVLFDKNTTHGLVRLRVKKANEALNDILDRWLARAATQQQPNIFDTITEDDIDNLFS
jgi:predicted regulator of Ras-like GTPase activity (Roadblock/LC7/MglB family)